MQWLNDTISRKFIKMEKNLKKERVRKLSYRIGLMIILTQVIALVGLGAFYITRFTNQLNSGITEKFSTPGYLMSKGMLRYQTVQDKATMESLVSEEIDNCMIIGANGKVFYALNKQYQDQNVDDISFLRQFHELSQEVTENIFIEKVEDNENFLYTLSPIHQEDGKFLGYLFIKARMEQFVKEKHSILLIFILGSILCIVLSTLIILFVFNQWFAVKIKVIVGRITELAKGKQVDLLEVTEDDEIGVIKRSINELIEGTEGRIVFADEIAQGNFDVKFEALSDGDLVGKSLLNMRENLKHAQEMEVERQKEANIQNWITTGLANFAEILRQDNDNIKKLSYNFIIELINYMEATQGALFVLNDADEDDIFYEASAIVAYGREKTVETRIKVGEGLIGRAAHERLTIYMTEVPTGYVKITSGLGQANPNCVLVVPLVVESNVVGVIELVSFNKMEKYQVEFVEKLAVSMASTLINVKINERTGRLLAESQKQREELLAQEEEVRQNLEEMTAIKEEAARKEEEMNSLWRAVKEENAVALYELSGKITEANNQFIEVFSEFIADRSNMNIKEIMQKGFLSDNSYQNFSNKINLGQSQRTEIEIKREGVVYKLIQSHVPMKNSNGAVDKFMSIGMLVKA